MKRFASIVSLIVTGACVDGEPPSQLSPKAILYVVRDGPGIGSVASVPALPDEGINCGRKCSRAYPLGSAATLRATPLENSRFDGWNGGCAGRGDCRITLGSDTVVWARFSLAPVEEAPVEWLKVVSGPGGTVVSEPPGVYCGALCLAAFPVGAKVTLTAIPDRASAFLGWARDCADAGRCEIVMDGAKRVEASFGFELAVRPEWLSRSQGAPGADGEVVSEPEGIRCGSTCRAVFAPDEVVALRAIPSEGTRFLGWTGLCEVDAGGCTVTMREPRTIKATFQSVGLIWVREFLGGFHPDGLAIDPSGAAILGGQYQGGITIGDAGFRSSRSATLIAKFESTGALAWAHSFVSDAGVGARPCVSSVGCEGVSTVATDPFGNIVFAQPFSGQLIFEGNNDGGMESDGGTDILLAKLSPTGTLIWAKTFGGPDDDWPEGVGIEPGGEIAMTGALSHSAYVISGRGFLSKFASDGTLRWMRLFSTASPRGVSFGPNGKILVTGTMRNAIAFSDDGGVRVPGVHGFVAKYESNGVNNWGIVWGGQRSSVAFSLAADPFGSVVVTGSFLGFVDVGGETIVNTSSDRRTSLLVKYNGDGGSVAWARTMGSLFGFASDYTPYGGPSVAIDDQGDTSVVGIFRGAVNLGGDVIRVSVPELYWPTVFAAKYGPNGEHRWSTSLGTLSSYRYSWQSPLRVAVARDRSIVVAAQFRAFDWSHRARWADGRTYYALMKLAP